VNVDFEWFNFDPEVDFHGMKTLLRQLFDVDGALFDISGLADLIISQNTIGSAVKVDSKANDAYAFLTVLNLYEHREHEAVARLIQYIKQKARTNEALATVPSLLDAGKHVGLVLSERLLNMPAEIAPPMYTMLLDEIEAAVEDKEPYEFSHYLIISKTYHEVASTLDDGERKKKKVKDDAPLFYFHPEDEILQKHASANGTYAYTRDDETVSDSKRAFQEMGVRSQGLMILIDAGKFEPAVKAMSDYLSPS
jgi:protein BCP1